MFSFFDFRSSFARFSDFIEASRVKKFDDFLLRFSVLNGAKVKNNGAKVR